MQKAFQNKRSLPNLRTFSGSERWDQKLAQEESKTCHRLLYGDGGRISPSLSLPQPEGFHLVVDPGPPLKFGSNMVRH